MVRPDPDGITRNLLQRIERRLSTGSENTTSDFHRLQIGHFVIVVIGVIRLAVGDDELESAFDKLSKPVVLKIDSKKHSHKTKRNLQRGYQLAIQLLPGISLSEVEYPSSNEGSLYQLPIQLILIARQ